MNPENDSMLLRNVPYQPNHTATKWLISQQIYTMWVPNVTVTGLLFFRPVKVSLFYLTTVGCCIVLP